MTKTVGGTGTIKADRNRDRNGKNAANALFIDTESSGLEPGRIWWKSVLQSRAHLDICEEMYEHSDSRNCIRVSGGTQVRHYDCTCDPWSGSKPQSQNHDRNEILKPHFASICTKLHTM
jgi:hypothetical protein